MKARAILNRNFETRYWRSNICRMLWKFRSGKMTFTSNRRWELSGRLPNGIHNWTEISEGEAKSFMPRAFEE